MSFVSRLWNAFYITMPHILPLDPIREGDSITYHKHWAILLRAITAPSALLCLVIPAWYWVLTGKPDTQSTVVTGGVLVLNTFALLWLLWRYEDWRNDYYVITADRIIDVKRLPLGFHTVTVEASMSNVQNISMRIPNIIAASLGFGNVEIDTAGRQGQLVFESVAKPREVLAEVSARIDAFRDRRRSREKERGEREILDWFAAHADLERIKIVRNPPSAISASPVVLEWRVEGKPAIVETLVAWDNESHPERDYGYQTPVQIGGIGNYTADFMPVNPGKVFFAVMAKIDGSAYWSMEHWIPVEPKERRA